MSRSLAGFLALMFALPAYSLGLGDVQGKAVIGRTLHLEVPIIGADNVREQISCVRLIPDGDDADLVNISLRVERRKLILSSNRMITQPVIRFRIRMGCPAFLEEAYVILAEPSETTTDAPLRFGTEKVVAPVVERRDGERLTVRSQTTLRLLSRERFPESSSARVRFIRKVAAVNPQLFVSEARAYDQPLVAGTELMMPPEESVAARSPAPARQPRPTESASRIGPDAASKPLPRDSKGRGPGRLVIGATDLSLRGPTTAELSESLDRLTEAMSEQVTVELAMIERLKGLETDLAAVKRQAADERAAVARLEGELKQLREKADRDSSFKLVLIILLGGLVSAIGLRWFMDRRSQLRWGPESVVTPAKVVPSSVLQQASRQPPATIVTPMDDLDDLLSPRK